MKLATQFILIWFFFFLSINTFKILKFHPPLESSVDAKIVLSRFIKRLSFLQAILDSWDQCSRDNTHCNHLKMAGNFPGVCTSAVRCVQKQLKPDFAHPWICISTSTWRCNLLQLKRTGIMLTYALLSIQEKTR